MKGLIIATDLDGTFYKLKPLMEHLDVPFYVITGCQNKEVIEKKLKGTKCLKYWSYPGKFNEDLDIYLHDVAIWKAKMIKKLKADYFYDDDNRVMRAVHKLTKAICLEVW
jgi:hypothetical protein